MAIDKLVDSSALDTGLTTIAVAIRSKTGGTETLSFPSGMANAINGIQILKEEETFTVVPDVVSQNVIPTAGKVFSSGVVTGIPRTNTYNEQGGITVEIA